MCIGCKNFTNKMCFSSRRNLDATLTCDKMCHSLSTLISHLPTTLLATKSKGCLQYQYRMGEAKCGVEAMSAFLRFSISSSSCEFWNFEYSIETRERESIQKPKYPTRLTHSSFEQPKVFFKINKAPLSREP